MRKKQCHRCNNENFLAVTSDPEIPCPCCGCQYGSIVVSIPSITPSRLKIISDIDISEPLDITLTKIVAFFIGNGMSVADVAKQLGTSRATIYARLKKYNLLKTQSNDPFQLHINAMDDFTSGKSTHKISRNL